MSLNRMLCALLCALLALCVSACGKTDGEQTTMLRETVTEPVSAPDSTTDTTTADVSAPTVPEEAPSAMTETEAVSESAAVSLHDGLNSTDTAQVLAYYQLAAAANDVRQYTKTLNLISLNGGEGKVGSYVSVFEPIAKKAVSNNSVSGEALPGRYKTIRPEDWLSASAVNDGKFTTVRVRVAPQTDTANGKEFEGPVGRSMTVLDGVQMAVDEMPGVSADFDTGKLTVSYLDPVITIKVNNSTGKFVPGSCRWSYRVHVSVASLDAKVLAFNVHLQNASGDVDYAVTY